MTNELTKISGTVELCDVDYGWYKVTVRANGKCHRALATANGRIEHITCGCPNTKNGRLANQAKIIANGWTVNNCKN